MASPWHLHRADDARATHASNLIGQPHAPGHRPVSMSQDCRQLPDALQHDQPARDDGPSSSSPAYFTPGVWGLLPDSSFVQNLQRVRQVDSVGDLSGGSSRGHSGPTLAGFDASATLDVQDCPELPHALQHDQTASDGPCSSRARLLLPTTFTSDVWARLAPSSQELMQEALSLMDSELEKSYMQQHPSEAGPAPAAQGAAQAGPAPAAQGAPHATAQYKLNAVSVAHIFLQKRASPQDRNLSSRLAAEYGVTTKAVRDIWNGRTWTSITQLL